LYLKLALKILKWTALGIICILVLLAGFSIFLQDKIVTIFINSVNKNLSTKIEVAKGSFSLINKFPKGSVKLERVFIHSSPKFDRTQFKKTNTDTLLYAKSVICEFKITDIINGRYNIESINVNSGLLYLFSDSSGGINYDISLGNASSPDKIFVINLDKIIVSDITASYSNVATSFNINGLINNGRFKSRITGNVIDFTASSSMLLSRLEIFPVFLRTSATASLELNLHKSDSGFLFRKGTFKIDNFSFSIAGNIFDDNRLNLRVSGQNIDVSKIKKFLPVEYKNSFTEYDPAGILKTEAVLTGLADRKHNPEIRLSFSLEKGHVNYNKSNLKLEKFSFSGTFFNGKYRSPQTSSIIFNKFKATLGSSDYTGSFKIENFKKPKINLVLSGKVIPSELSEFFNIKEVTSAKGSVTMNLKLSGVLPLKNKYVPADFLKLNPEADLHFKSLSLEITKYKLAFKDINGSIYLNRNLKADSLSFYYKNQFFKIDGYFTNLTPWLIGKPVQIKSIANISINNFNPSFFIPDSSSVDQKQTAFKLPKGIELDINLDIENLIYKKFSASRVRGKLLYRPGLLTFKSLNISSMDGNISGDCFLAQGERNTFISNGNFSFEKIDINKAFISFNNFGQDFIKAGNLAGSLTGKLSLLLPLDSKLSPIANAVTAEGKYIISDGALLNFEPVKSLSEFIELSELENITFSKLENDFYIKNSYVAIPQMDIRSSAADFSINGKHGFDNDYEYHVKTYLSVILSKKVKKSRKSSTEFGTIEDDGLGRTSVFLKVTGKGENIKVGYDLKAAGGKLKQNFKTEKESLKSILNKEYGWYKKDTIIKQETAPQPKFSIQWDDSDTTEMAIDTAVVNKDRGINSIFKKKK
jgi:hypothetical protein